MSETIKAVKPEVKVEHIEAISLKHPPTPRPENDDYKICYVDKDSKLVNAPCTKSVWTTVTQNRLDYKKNCDFLLRREDGKITYVTIKERKDSMQGFTKVHEKTEDYPGALVLKRNPDNTVTADRIPERVPSQLVSDLCESVAKTERRELHSGNKLMDRYQVLEVRDKIDGDLIFIKPMAQ